MSTILIVEDEEAVRANLAELLDAEGFQVLEAADGRAGVEAARAHAPDLILCDIMMPELDGHGVLEALRAEPSTAAIPFIFLTARADRTDLRRGMNLGADDYLTKPFTREELLTALSCRLARRAAAEEQAQDRMEALRGSIALAIPHELRTPLSGILGAAAILVEEYASAGREEIREMAASIQVSAERLNDLILHFLFYTELEIAARDPEYARRMIEFPGCRVREVAGPAALREARRAGREGDLQVEVEEGMACASSNFLERILHEVAGNAFKFSPSGTPVQLRGAPEDGHYTLTVRDRGRGMTGEQIARIGGYMQFERRQHEQQGSGLGLIIARRIAEIHGGAMTIESAPREGTAVTVTLPETIALLEPFDGAEEPDRPEKPAARG